MEWWIVSIYGEAICLYRQFIPGMQPCSQGTFSHSKAVYSTLEGQLELTEASSLAATSRLASTLLMYVQWLSGKSVRLAIGRF